MFFTSLNTRATVSVSRSSLLRNHLIFAARAELRDGTDGEGSELNGEDEEETRERERERKSGAHVADSGSEHQEE